MSEFYIRKEVWSMLEMMTSFANAEKGVYILWGIALLGLILKLITNAYVKSLMRAAENMATTRKKSVRILRQKYENRQNLGMEGNSSRDFVEKNVRRMKWAGLPIETICKPGNIGVLTAVMVTAGAFLFYDNTWRGSPRMTALIVNGIIVCAFLLTLENIFLTRNKLEIMKANVRDYLDNMSAGRRSPVPIRKVRNYEEDADVKKSAPIDETDSQTAASEENALDSFLKEFFS